jgi:pyruvate ferredoxin oxidoreductase gamma subunit
VFEIRIHGRGGQGVVTAAELLSVAAFYEGRHAQAFPSFGSERTGAPVVSFCRLDDRPIRVHDPIVTPDAVVIIDPTLIHQVDVFAGLGQDGYLLINTARSLDELGLGELLGRFRRERLQAVPATQFARELLGRPLPNAAVLGAFAAQSDAVSLGSVTRAIGERFGGTVGEGNIAAAERAFAFVHGRLGKPIAQLSPGGQEAVRA